MTPVAALAAGLVAGFASAPHCIGMCGPLAAFACAGEGRTLASVGKYQLGRTVTYVLLGAFAGWASTALGDVLRADWIGSALSFAFALAMAWLAVRLWRAARSSARAADDAGAGQALAQLGRAKLPERRRGPLTPLIVGLASGFLPCGALGIFLLAAAATASPLAGASLGVGFVTATGLGLAVAGGLARYLARLGRPLVLRTLAVALAVGAALFLVRSVPAEKPCCGSEPAARTSF